MQPVSSTPLSPQPNTHDDPTAVSLSLRFWITLLIAGAAAGLLGGLLMRLLYFVEHHAWAYSTGVFLQAVSVATSQRRVVNLILAGIVVGVGGALVRRCFADAGGDVDGAIWKNFGKVPFIATVSKAVVSITGVGLGMSLGRESPIKQAGGAVASKLSDWTGLSDSQRQLLVACGVGAGMASAYNVPLGGAIFAAEVLIGSLSLQKVLPALVASCVATAASWLLLPIAPIYSVPEFSMSFPLLGWSIFAGPLLGLGAVLFVRLIAWAERNRPKANSAILLPILVMTGLGFLAIAYPQLLGNGKDTAQIAFNDQFALRLLCVLPILKLIATVMCLRSGASGGLFTPVMTVGALLGGAMGRVWSTVFPGAMPGSYAVVGASAMLAAATRGPVSSLVLVLELTRRSDAIMVPMLIAVTGATIVAGQIESRSIYSARVSGND